MIGIAVNQLDNRLQLEVATKLMSMVFGAAKQDCKSKRVDNIIACAV